MEPETAVVYGRLKPSSKGSPTYMAIFSSSFTATVCKIGIQIPAHPRRWTKSADAVDVPSESRSAVILAATTVMVVQIWRTVSSQTSPARIFDPVKALVQFAQGLVCRPDDRAKMVAVLSETAHISKPAAPSAVCSVPCVGTITQVMDTVEQPVLGRRFETKLHRR